MADMDLLDFSTEAVLRRCPACRGGGLIAQAAATTATRPPNPPAARLFLAPEHLSGAGRLYRYYFYQHRLEDALLVADHADSRLGPPPGTRWTGGAASKPSSLGRGDALDRPAALPPAGAEGRSASFCCASAASTESRAV
jgi:hypothetical protein